MNDDIEHHRRGEHDATTGRSGYCQLLGDQSKRIVNQRSHLPAVAGGADSEPDPLNPTDSIQFVGQLGAIQPIRQLLNINQNMVRDQTAVTGI